MNITLLVIADVIQSVYYNGRPKSDKKLDRDDFFQMARMSYGTVMRQLYYDAKNRGENPAECFAQQVEPIEVNVGEPDAKGRRIVELETDVMVLPKGLGIMQVTAAPGESVDVTFYRIQSGSEWLYEGREFEDVPHFAPRGQNRVVLFNAPDELAKVEVYVLKAEEESVVPEDAAFDVVNHVLGVALKVAGFPVDKTNNMNPNNITIKQKLSQTESI